MHESHNTSISAMSTTFHKITAASSVSVIFVACTEAITCQPQIVTYKGGMGGTKGSKVAP